MTGLHLHLSSFISMEPSVTKAEASHLISYYRAIQTASHAADKVGEDFQCAIADMQTLREFATSVLTRSMSNISAKDIEAILSKWDSERAIVTACTGATRKAFVQLRVAIDNTDKVRALEYYTFKESMRKYEKTQEHSALTAAKVAWVKYREAVFDAAALQEETASLVSGFVTDIDYLISLIKKSTHKRQK